MIMGKLKSPKISAELRKLPPLRPVQQRATRWLSTMQMLERYLSIKDHFSKIPGFLELLFSSVEDNEVKELSKIMVPLKFVTLALQRDDTDTASVRPSFDELLPTIPKLDAKDRYLKPNSKIVKFPDFEQGIVKILNGEEAVMSVNEQLACRKPRKSNAFNVEEVDSHDVADFASAVLAKRLKQAPLLKYVSCMFLLPTSNFSERFFSSAGYAYHELRLNLLPMKLEQQLFLKFNKEHWNLFLSMTWLI